MSLRTAAGLMIASACALPGLGLAGDTSAEKIATAKWIVEQARAWSDQACGGRWVITELLADDFKGTAPNGSRYEKPTGEPPYDATTLWSKDCRLDQADVKFFGPDVAVAYGTESKTASLPEGKSERRCLAWTDTWFRRKGKWQIIAVQDNRIECPRL